MAIQTINVDFGSTDYSKDVCLVASDKTRSGDSTMMAPVLKLGTSAHDMNLSEGNQQGFCTIPYYRLVSNQSPQSGSVNSVANYSSIPLISGWKLTSRTDNYEKAVEGIDEFWGISGENYTSWQLEDDIKNRWMELTKGKTVPDLLPGGPSPIYFDTEGNIMQFLARLESSRTGKLIYINKKVPYYMSESGGVKTYRIAGDHDPYYAPGQNAVDGAEEVVEIIHEDGKRPVFKTINKTGVDAWIKTKVELFRIVYYQLKLKCLYLFVGKNLMDEADISSDLGTIVDGIEYNLRDAAKSAYTYGNNFGNGGEMLRKLTASELIEQTHAQALSMVQSTCEKRGYKYQGPGKPSFPRYTAVVEIKTIANPTVIENNAKLAVNPSSTRNNQRTMLYTARKLGEMYARYNTPQQWFKAQLVNQLVLNGNPSNLDSYIENAFFKSSCTFEQMGDSEVTAFEKPYEGEDSRIGKVPGTITTVPESKIEEYRKQRLTKKALNSSKYGQPYEVDKCDIPRTTTTSGNNLDDVELNSRFQGTSSATPETLGQNMGNQVKALAGVQEDEGESGWDFFCRIARGTARGIGREVGDAADWVGDTWNSYEYDWDASVWRINGVPTIKIPK